MATLSPPRNILHKSEKPPTKNNEVFNEDSLEPYERSDEYYDNLFGSLVSEARCTPCDSGSLVPPDWMDEALIRESIRFSQKYFVNIILSQLTSHLIFYCDKNSSRAVYTFMEHLSPKEINQKIFLVIEMIDKFFVINCDQDEALKIFDHVRELIANSRKNPVLEENINKDIANTEKWKEELARAVRADLEYMDISTTSNEDLLDKCNFNQLELSVLLFSAIFNMWFSSKMLFGVEKDKRVGEFKALVHTWAVFGRLLGLQDKHNICHHLNSSFYDKICQNFIVNNLKNLDETVITMQDKFVEAVKISVPFVTYKALLFVAMEGWENFKGDNLRKTMNWKDKLCLKILRILMWLMSNVSLLRYFLNRILTWYLNIQFWGISNDKPTMRKYFFPFC